VKWVLIFIAIGTREVKVIDSWEWSAGIFPCFEKATRLSVEGRTLEYHCILATEETVELIRTKDGNNSKH